MKPPNNSRLQFLAEVQARLADHSLSRLVLSKYRGADTGLQRLVVRPVQLRGQQQLSFVFSHPTRDTTKNLPLAEGLAQLSGLLEHDFGQAHLLLAGGGGTELAISKKGQATLRQHGAPATPTAAQAADEGADGPPGPPPAQQEHNRAKHRYVDIRRPFLAELGVTTRAQQLVPAMARKWKQINKFVEVLDHALQRSPLKDQQRLQVADFGAGKGYLTFALHDHLHTTLGRDAQVTGVELREDLVTLCNAAAQRCQMPGLSFAHGDVRSVAPPQLDIMIALHACDTATDHAIHTGIQTGAAIIMCSPCCHKEVRPQLLSPGVLRPMLQHGIHLGQQAEMVTDSLRALLLEAHGYDTQVFEFVALEHTSKNKMILATRRQQPKPADPVLAQIRAIKDFYGVREQCLETLLSRRGLAVQAATADRATPSR